MSLWDVFLSIFWFMLLFAWIWMRVTILADIFRDHDLPGWRKAMWTLFIIVIPWLGALVYLVARGRSMNERTRTQAQRQDHASRQYVRQVAGSSPSMADELAKLSDLRDRGRSRSKSSRKPKPDCSAPGHRSWPPRLLTSRRGSAESCSRPVCEERLRHRRARRSSE
jgi:uncharacterized membrane protein YcjF (UPF0283 family)